MGSAVPCLKHPSGSVQPSCGHAVRPAQVVCVHSVHIKTTKWSSCSSLNEHVTTRTHNEERGRERNTNTYILDKKKFKLSPRLGILEVYVRGLVLAEGGMLTFLGFLKVCAYYIFPTIRRKATIFSDSGSMVLYMYMYHHACITTHDIHTCAAYLVTCPAWVKTKRFSHVHDCVMLLPSSPRLTTSP